MNDTDVTYCTCGDEKLVCPDCLVDIIDKQERELAAARARITILEGCINDMTEEQAAICAEGQSITELVAAKDKLIKRMRVCKICKHYDCDDLGTDHYCNLGMKPPHPCEKWELDDGELRVWACPALEAAERGEE